VGDLLVGRVAVGAVVVLVVNDRWLKARAGADARWGIVTGKLSDVAGLVFFPLLLASLVELGRWLRRKEPWAATRRELGWAAAATGAAFAAIKVVPAAAATYVGVLAVLRWLPAALADLPAAASPPPLPRIHHVMDITDCLCVPAVWWSYRIGVRARGLRARWQR
jgi:hypothetical protein